MPQRFAVIAAMLAAFAAAPAPALAQAKPEAARPADFKIGVVDLGQVFLQYKKASHLEQKINDERDRLRRELDEMRKKRDEMWKQLDLLDPESETYRAMEDEKDALTSKMEQFKRRGEERVKGTWAKYNLELLDDIEDEVRKFGEDNGFMLILKIEGKPPTREARLLKGAEGVLYRAKELDITPQVVEVLNRRYDKGAAAPAKAATEKPAGAEKPAGGEKPDGTAKPAGHEKPAGK